MRSTPMRPARRLAALAAAVAVAFAACGGDDDDDAADPATSTATAGASTPVDGSAAGSSSTPSAGSGAGTTAPAFADEEPVEGGDLRVVYSSNPSSLDPVQGGSGGDHVSLYLF